MTTQTKNAATALVAGAALASGLDVTKLPDRLTDELARIETAENTARKAFENAGKTVEAGKIMREALNNAKQRREWCGVIAAMTQDELALYSQVLSNWSALVSPADLYNMRDAGHQFVQAALGRGALRTSFKDFLKQFETKKKLALPAQSFRNNVLRRVDGVSFYTGDTALRWAKGCAKALEQLGHAAQITGRADECVISVDPDAVIMKMLAQQKVVTLPSAK